VTAVPHACGHSDEAPAGLERAQQPTAAPVVIVAPAAWSPEPQRIGFDRVASVDTSPPQSRPLQLRV
jgi:hypothetical protein